MYKLLYKRDSDARFIIDDTPNASLMYIQSEATKLKQKYDIKFLFIDYLQLITVPALATREREISAICKGLKALSANLGIPVIVLAQLNRSVETRGGTKRPQMSDLRGGGSIEEDSSMVSFIYRPEYYGIMEDENGQSLEGITEIITCKNRHGEIGNDYLYMNKSVSTFDMFDPSTGEQKTLDQYDMKLVTIQDMNEEEENRNFFTDKIKENGQWN
jgi:replicative DNA helicase